MKAGKILIVMIIVAQGFSANAQRNVKAGNNFNPVNQYSRILDLSKNQVTEWSQLNDYYDNEYANVKNDDSLTRKGKRKKRKQLHTDKTNKLKALLSPRQYRGYANLSWNNSRQNYRNFYYNNYRYRGSRFGYRNRRSGFSRSRFGYGSNFRHSSFSRTRSFGY